jgi:rare lipoprotein A
MLATLRPLRAPSALGLWLLLCLALAGCHNKQPKSPSATQTAPTYPDQQPLPPQTSPSQASRTRPPARIPITPVPPGGTTLDDIDFIATHRPILTEEGLATWYTAVKGRKAANGQLFDDDAMTAAHRTLPMGSLIVVTNLKTRQSAALRITDRGPFADGRILDLTTAAAKAIGLYRAGLAPVRLQVYQAPKPIDTGGRWCVQIGSFSSEDSALALKRQLLRRYPTANVIEFPGENSYWVRIRPEGDDRAQAEEIASTLRPSEGSAFLTRLD